MTNTVETQVKTKKCAKCGRTLILRRFNKDRSKPSGHSSYCKQCSVKSSQGWKSRNPDRCNELSRQYRERNPELVRQRSREFNRKKRAENPEYFRDACRRSYARNRDRRTQEMRTYYAEHPQYWREYSHDHREQINACNRVWQKTPKGRACAKAKNIRRKARLRGATVVTIRQVQLEEKWKFWAGKCWMCGHEATSWDHVKPITKGTLLHVLSNLRPACISCNASKNNKWYGVLWVKGLRR